MDQMGSIITAVIMSLAYVHVFSGKSWMIMLLIYLVSYVSYALIKAFMRGLLS